MGRTRCTDCEKFLCEDCSINHTNFHSKQGHTHVSSGYSQICDTESTSDYVEKYKLPDPPFKSSKSLGTELTSTYLGKHRLPDTPYFQPSKTTDKESISGFIEKPRTTNLPFLESTENNEEKLSYNNIEKLPYDYTEKRQSFDIPSAESSIKTCTNITSTRDFIRNRRRSDVSPFELPKFDVMELKDDFAEKVNVKRQSRFHRLTSPGRLRVDEYEKITRNISPYESDHRSDAVSLDSGVGSDISMTSEIFKRETTHLDDTTVTKYSRVHRLPFERKIRLDQLRSDKHKNVTKNISPYEHFRSPDDAVSLDSGKDFAKLRETRHSVGSNVVASDVNQMITVSDDPDIKLSLRRVIELPETHVSCI